MRNPYINSLATVFPVKLTMKMYLPILLMFLCAMNTNAQGLTPVTKKKLKKELKAMGEMDQRYRKLMADNPAMNNDSIWHLQSTLDSMNRLKLLEIIAEYGYPSRKNVGYETSIALLLHFTTEKDFTDLNAIFKSELEHGNMLPEYYAWWYDRCLRNMNQAIFYGQYTNQKEFCGDEWISFNLHRKEIGLKPLNGKANCD